MHINFIEAELETVPDPQIFGRPSIVDNIGGKTAKNKAKIQSKNKVGN